MRGTPARPARRAADRQDTARRRGRRRSGRSSATVSAAERGWQRRGGERWRAVAEGYPRRRGRGAAATRAPELRYNYTLHDGWFTRSLSPLPPGGGGLGRGGFVWTDHQEKR